MAHFPAPRPDDSEAWQPDTPSRGQLQPQVEELATRLEAHGIQSTELVLDLVLHDLADEARQAVGASGAAIALEREGELVCRAAAGSTAPDLGVRIQTESGLSGICVTEGRPQICSDTESDERVDPQACRQLGVRSIVVVPLFSDDEIIGVFEVFSSRPNAFTEEDVKKLQSLAATVAQTVQAAWQKAAPTAEARAAANSDRTPQPSFTLSVDSIMEKVSPMDPAVRVLRWLVIGLAIPLLILIGFDLGHRVHSRMHPLSHPVVEQSPIAQAQSENSPPNLTAPRPPDSQVVAAPKRRANDSVGRRGGLVIYQNGKIIYREIPSASSHPVSSQAPRTVSNNGSAADKDPAVQLQAAEADDNSSISLPPGVTGGRLLRRVRPQYPAEAVLEKREGAVVLHGTVGQDGAMHDLKVVSGDTILSAAAFEAVQHWTYEPYRRNGELVDMPIDITIDFNLPK